MRRLLEDSTNLVAAATRNPRGSAALQSLCKTYGNDRLLLLTVDFTNDESIKVNLFCLSMYSLSLWGAVF